ncbi:hypothetical protein [Clostridium tetani]|uniref:hypothetical protein n=1 Tax=Clostridium tetani TaxID=1513 RepID=UPI00100C2687|nr:hypothetical protein [Clostridium tetani]RXI50177.1 hypothetical protein DP122_13310 [Clostridium tetani]RXI54294.1 hypothetical protein DP124_04070 [Clostridium tetani]RXM58681.1 hypothetical protein DP133_03320 [Clostridium tetani]RXM68771.1 hypothetical protein DP139_11890 [Clostridium tetani]BDR64249.1 hypothetical protein K134307016_11830 [Clostridium tetani]
MNKRIKFIMPILCGVLLSSSLAFTNVQAAAIHESNATISTTNEKDMSNSHFDENVEIKEITREEYLKTYAEKRGVSIEEADRLEKLETEKSIKDEISTKAKGGETILTRKSVLLRESISPRQTVYKEVAKTYDIGNSNFESRVVVSIHIKLQRYNSSSYGTYQKFSQVLSKGARSFGSGRSNVDPIALSADIFGDTGYGNKMKMMLSANVVHEISVSLSGTAKRAGFDISGGIGGPYYARKYVSLNDTFSSNWDLS